MSAFTWREHTGVHQSDAPIGISAMVEMGTDGIGDAFQEWNFSWAVLDDDLLLAAGVADSVPEAKRVAEAVMTAMGAAPPEGY